MSDYERDLDAEIAQDNARDAFEEHADRLSRAEGLIEQFIENLQIGSPFAQPPRLRNLIDQARAFLSKKDQPKP